METIGIGNAIDQNGCCDGKHRDGYKQTVLNGFLVEVHEVGNDESRRTQSGVARGDSGTDDTQNTYNANPTSMTAAINAFKGNCYILGAMRELGEYSHLEHQNIVNMLLERKAEKVLLVGEEYKETTAPYPVYDNIEQLYEALQAEPLIGYTILLKGSRSNQMEKILPLL